MWVVRLSFTEIKLLKDLFDLSGNDCFQFFDSRAVELQRSMSNLPLHFPRRAEVSEADGVAVVGIYISRVHTRSARKIVDVFQKGDSSGRDVTDDNSPLASQEDLKDATIFLAEGRQIGEWSRPQVVEIADDGQGGRPRWIIHGIINIALYHAVEK